MRIGLLVLALLTFAGVAQAAPSKEECIASFDKGQQARRTGQLREARKELLVCSQNECPTIVRADCSGVLRQVEQELPTIVLSAKDSSGVDVNSGVVVTIDGEKPADVQLGRARPIDPGKHVVVFEHPPLKAVTMDVVVAEGEKGRRVEATFIVPDTKPKSKALTTTPPPPPEPKRSVVGWVVPGGLAAVALGSFAFAGITRLNLGNEADDLRASCAPECSQVDRDRMSSDLVATNVMLGVGLGAVALAVASWFILAPKQEAAPR